MRWHLLCALLLAVQFSNAQWNIVAEVPFEGEYLVDIEVVDSLTVFAVGHNVILRTEDGGDTWDADSSIVFVGGFHTCQFPTRDTGYIFTESGTKYLVTYDGGDTWNARTISYGFLGTTEVQMITTQRGYGVDEVGGMFFYVHNGGDSVTFRSFTDPTGFRGLQFVNLDTGFVAGLFLSGFARTTDGGNTWDFIGTGLLDASIVQFPTLKSGWAIDYLNEELYRTLDSGNTWENILLDGVHGKKYAVNFSNDAIGYVHTWDTSSSEAFILKTVDSGDSWKRTDLPDSLRFDPIALVDIECYSPEYCFAAGPYQVLRTINGGGTYRPTGFQSLKYKIDLQIYPNPTPGIVNLKSNLTTSATLSIINSLGQLVYSGILEPGQTKIDLGDISGGLYTVVLTTEDSRSSEKLLILK